MKEDSSSLHVSPRTLCFLSKIIPRPGTLFRLSQVEKLSTRYVRWAVAVFRIDAICTIQPQVRTGEHNKIHPGRLCRRRMGLGLGYDWSNLHERPIGFAVGTMGIFEGVGRWYVCDTGGNLQMPYERLVAANHYRAFDELAISRPPAFVKGAPLSLASRLLFESADLSHLFERSLEDP